MPVKLIAKSILNEVDFFPELNFRETLGGMKSKMINPNFLYFRSIKNKSNKNVFNNFQNSNLR